MSAFTKALILGAVQLLLIAGIGAKFLIDRANYPRVWVLTAPFDPDLPIRGRYVRLAAVVEHGEPGHKEPVEMLRVRLAAQDGKLVAIADENGRHWLNERTCNGQPCWVLVQPLAYFIPEHVADPSQRQPGEELWVEVTVPPQGPPRPIRLGVKTGGKIEPLILQ